MRKKKHLDERLDACSPVCLGWIPDYVHKSERNEQLRIPDIFGNNHPLHLEIGCGKGSFAETIAERNPDINFIAVEQTANVIVSAMERTRDAGTPNLRYLMGKAEYLQKLIPPKSVDKLYLNFSCPFPKNKYAKHRLTHERFLEIYKDILIDDGIIVQKTDNSKFFEYSLNSLSDSGFRLRNITFDLHNSSITGNIITEYEQRFLSQGLPIYYLEAVNKKYERS